MKFSLEYSTLRNNRHDLVIKIVSMAGLGNCLRGSWVTDEFHVSIKDGSSFSDVDLASTEEVLITKEMLLKIEARLNSAGFPLRVSTHQEKSLKQVNLKDWRVLKICEYISKFPLIHGNPVAISYWRAKTILLLLQMEVNEGYTAITNRIGTEDAQIALDVKLGAKLVFTLDNATRLINSFGNDDSRDFLEQCIISDPSISYREEVAQRLKCCQSVNSWLQDYVLKKMYVK